MQLQYIVSASTPEAITAEARAAMERGIRWIEIKAPDALPADELAGVVDALRPELAEKECILILADRPQQAHDLKADGVHIYTRSEPVSKIRMEIEAWPIVGMSVADAQDAATFRANDIDYLFFAPGQYDEAALAQVAALAKYIADNELETPLVCGGATAGDLPALRSAGADAAALCTLDDIPNNV